MVTLFADVAPHLPAERRSHLRPPRVILDARQLLGRPLGLRDHAAVGRDQRHPRSGRAGGPAGEGVGGRVRSGGERGARVVVKDPSERHQARLQRLHRERLERPVQVEPGGEQGHPDEAHQRQRELDRDATTEEADDPAHDASGLRREAVAHALDRENPPALAAELGAQPPHVHVDGARLDLVGSRVAPDVIEEELAREDAARALRGARGAGRTP